MEVVVQGAVGMVMEQGSIPKAPPASGNDVRTREKVGLGWSGLKEMCMVNCLPSMQSTYVQSPIPEHGDIYRHHPVKTPSLQLTTSGVCRLHQNTDSEICWTR